MRDPRPGHGRLRPLTPALALTHLALTLWACDGDTDVYALDGGGFVDVGSTGDTAVADSGGQAGGCVLHQPVPCEGSGCCDPAVPRCVPAIGGVNRCVGAGDLQRGDLCGPGGVDGVDGCGLNLVCLVVASIGTCTQSCAVDADCAEGTCTSVSTAGGTAMLCIAG